MTQALLKENPECRNLYDSIVKGNIEEASLYAKNLVNEYPPLDIIQECMSPAMKYVGDLFERLEIFLPEVLASADAFEAAMKYIGPKLEAQKIATPTKGKVVIGTIQGDIHDLGKNIVALMLKAHGFEVYDLGRDVPVYKFVEKAEEVNADIIAVSALLSTSLPFIKDLVRLLDEKGLRSKRLLMVGGGAVTREWATAIGADGYGENAAEAVKVAIELMQRSKVKGE
jgi:corrinoid protein of di/trimethylamine methyltransferase